MLIQKIHCPTGCNKATFSESIKKVIDKNSNLLLDSEKSSSSTKTVKVYTCNCCHTTFEIIEKDNSLRQVI
jgi:peroxiredoxin family protein